MKLSGVEVCHCVDGTKTTGDFQRVGCGHCLQGWLWALKHGTTTCCFSPVNDYRGFSAQQDAAFAAIAAQLEAATRREAIPSATDEAGKSVSVSDLEAGRESAP